MYQPTAHAKAYTMCTSLPYMYQHSLGNSNDLEKVLYIICQKKLGEMLHFLGKVALCLLMPDIDYFLCFFLNFYFQLALDKLVSVQLL